MDFKFTDEQIMIRDTAEAFLVANCSSTAVRQFMDTELGYDLNLWKRICDQMYLQVLVVTEYNGGSGRGYVELASM